MIGATGDTGGSATAGSIMAKLNGIFTNAARLTSAHATKIDNIGATGDTGGTASAGTVMGKLNAIISSLANIGGSSVNASDITAIKTATEATTTENASGTLSAKLSYLINRRDRIVTPSSTNLKTLSTNLSLTTTADKLSGNSYTTVGKSWYSSNTNSVFIKHDGTYRIYCTASLTMQTNNSGNSYAYFQVIVGTSGLPA